MFIFILGRQPEFGLAELCAVFGNAELVLSNVALVETDRSLDIDRLGSVRKVGRVIWNQPISDDANKFLIDKFFALPAGKITLAISSYGRGASVGSAQKTGLFLKKNLSRSVRVLPNSEPEISDAATLGNRLGTSSNKIELMMIRTGQRLIIAQLIGVQNLDSYTLRDRGRPKRDARVGMLPPKLAQTMINLAVGDIEKIAAARDISLRDHLFRRGKASQPPRNDERGAACLVKEDPEQAADQVSLDHGHPVHSSTKNSRDFRNYNDDSLVLLDPFCGTGVVLQEASLMGFRVYGTDLEPRMIDYTNENLDWLKRRFRLDNMELLTCVGDATNFHWIKLIKAANQNSFNKHAKKTLLWPERIDFVATETYLGRPYSSDPTEESLRENITNCELILTKFLKNLRPQITDQTGLCIAVPCWFVGGRTRHLPLTRKLTEIGFEQISYSKESRPLIYHRENQIVGRELLILKKVLRKKS